MGERVKIQFHLNPEDGQGYQTESVWAERVGPNELRVLNSPFFAFGVSMDDIVSAKNHEGTYEFDGVVRKGGHSTYRVFMQGGNNIRSEPFSARWNEIRALGATFENANDQMISVDVPPQADITKVYDLLSRGESDGIWAFEEGNYEEPQSRVN